MDLWQLHIFCRVVERKSFSGAAETVHLSQPTVKSHVGVSILSRLAVAEEIRSGALKALTVEGLDLTRSFFLAHHRQRSLSPLGLAFIELLKAHLKP